MRRWLSILVFLLLITVFCVGQTPYVSRYMLDANIEKFTLIDTTSEAKFILDPTQIYITAIDKDGKQLWQTDPWKDNNLEEYRAERPIIVIFYLANITGNYLEDIRGNKEVIWICYSNTQFGIIDKLTGKFTWLGQD